MVTLRVGISSVTALQKKKNPTGPHNSKNLGFGTRLHFSIYEWCDSIEVLCPPSRYLPSIPTELSSG